MKQLIFILAISIAACSGKKSQEQTENQSIEVDSAQDFYSNPEQQEVYNYKRFAGIYDHESNTKGFAAVLNVTESGNDLSFTISVSQGSCKGEAEGKIIMVDHDENFYVGFFEPTTCPLQFTLMLQENKIDVKEINLCRLHESGCAFEGNYIKRKMN